MFKKESRTSNSLNANPEGSLNGLFVLSPGPSEAVAKLQCMEKTMILDQFTSRAAAGKSRPRAHTRRSRARGRGGKLTQKGVFNMRWSFATASSGSGQDELSQLGRKASLYHFQKIKAYFSCVKAPAV